MSTAQQTMTTADGVPIVPGMEVCLYGRSIKRVTVADVRGDCVFYSGDEMFGEAGDFTQASRVYASGVAMLAQVIEHQERGLAQLKTLLAQEREREAAAR